MAGLVDGTINGYLDIRGAILRVGQLDVVGISGVDMATNVIKQDSVLIWDDQGTDLNNPPFTLRGGATRDTTNGYHVLTGNSGGRLTRGIKLPNAWMMDFDLYASTSGGTVKFHTYTTSESTYDGSTGYELEFAPSLGTVTLRYRGTQVHQATSVTAYATNTFQHYVIGFERGAWTVSIDGTVVFLKDDDERADVYDNTAGQYFRIDASASAAYEIRMRKFRLASNGFWLKERNGNLSYETGNVSVGGRNATHRFDVRGTANVGALTSTTVATSASVEATDTATGTVTTHSIGVVSNAHVQNVYASNCIVDASLNVFSTANVGALTATSVDASDATAATSVSTGAIVVSGTDGGLGVASNIHATNVFAASHLGIATSDTDYNLDVRGTANVGVLSATLPLATVASNLVTYDTATGQLLDSNGLVSNKLAVVSELPPSALTASGVNNVDKHGNFKVSSSAGTTNYKAFNKSTAAASDAWSSATSVYGGTDNAYDGTASINSISGEWLRLDLPHASTLRYVTMTPTNDGTDGVAQFPEDFQLLGSSDDGASWTSLKSVTGQTASSVTDTKTIQVNAAARYRSYAVVVTKTGSSASLTSIGELKLFAESFSVDEGVVEFPGALEKGFMEHPVTPMTDYITRSDLGTYEADASSKNQWFGTYGSPFDYVIGNNMWASDQNWSSSNVYNNANWTTDVGGTRHYGEWLQLKLPCAVTLAYTDVYPRSLNTAGTNRGPGAGVILSSNDGYNWHKLAEFSEKTYTNGVATKIDVNATTAYTWYRIVTSNLANASASDTNVNIGEWRLFAEKPVTKLDNVHISGEISSETLQTGYIKWPRKSLKANESEGYVATASNVYNTDISTQPFAAFNDIREYLSNGFGPSFVSGNGDFTSGVANKSRQTGDDTFNHEWLQIQLPRAIQLSHFTLLQRLKNLDNDADMPKNGRMYASNDGVTWTKLVTFSDLEYERFEETRVDVKSSEAYKFYRLAITDTVGSSQAFVAVGELQLFETATGVGAPPTSAKLQVHGSLGMAKGSSVYAGDSVVMETPKNDRPLTRYPEFALTANSDRGYVVSRSSIWSNNWEGYKAFNRQRGTNLDWLSSDEYTNGVYGGTSKITDVHGTDYDGEWIKLQMPMAIRLKNFVLVDRDGADFTNRLPKDGTLLGSNDGSEWHVILRWTNRTFVTDVDNWFEVNSSRYYSRFGLVAEALKNDNGATSWDMGEIKYYGYEEGDESVDIVHRSVPNKPGTQHLSVWIDPGNKDSYSLGDNSKIYDLVDGRAGNVHGDKVFDPEFNSWYLDGSGDDIDGTITTTTGAWVHSISCWVKNDTANYTSGELFTFGPANGSQMVGLRFNGKDLIRSYFYSNDVLYHVKNNSDRWLHVVFTYDGGSSAQGNGVVGVNRKLYVNGEECLVESTGGTIGALNLQSTSYTYYVGRASWSSAQQKLKGYQGGLRVYNKVLSHEQVLELFDEGAERFGLREDLVSVHKGNLGIGLRDPEQRLVVAGNLQKFPPGDMDGVYMQFPGHGVFQASVSSVYNNTIASFGAHLAFSSGSSYWHSESTYSTASGYNPHTGSQSITAGDGTVYSGEWIQLSMPYQIHLKRIGASPRTTNYNRGPHAATLLARRNSGDDWVALTSWGNLVWTTTEASNGVVKYIEVNSEQPYSEFVMVTHLSNDSVNLSQMQFFGVPQTDVTDGRQLNVGQVNTSQVGIGTSNPRFPLQVNAIAKTGPGGVVSATALISSGTRLHSDWNNAYWDDAEDTGVWNYGSIYGKSDIITGGVFCSHSGTVSASDRRIKKNIADVNDSSALETFRLLQPKLYQYEDTYTRGSAAVWGFIAQEVADTLKLSTSKRVDYVPNVNGAANVHADGTVLEFDTTKLETGASKLRLYDRNDVEEDVDIAEIIDEYTVRLTKSIGNADQVFVYGQEVNDFHFLKKDAIWTTAAAALQEIDRQLQAEKAKTKTLESKLAGERVPLENAEGLAVDVNYAPCVTANDPLFLGIVGADGCVAAKGKRAKVWVTNIGAPLSAGDIIATTSNVAGYCSKLTDLTEVHRAVGKVLVDVALPQVTDHNFVAPTVPRRRKVTETSNVTVWVREFKSTAEQYATLGEDERRVRDEVYYARDDYVEVVRNEYVDKMPAYDVECYHRTQVDTCDAEIYEALPDSEKVNYVLGEDGVYTYTHVNMITIDAWNALGDDDERESFVHGYFKNVTEEMSEDEWEALEDSAVQARFEKRTRPVYFRLIVARESRHGYTEEVRAETVDVLDAFGRPTYEDVEGETDPAFEFRYLTAEGEISDRHSGVYMAALVECLLF